MPSSRTGDGRPAGPSGWQFTLGSIGMVELDQHHLFAPKIAELEHSSRGGQELEIWRPITHLHRHYLSGQGQQRRQQGCRALRPRAGTGEQIRRAFAPSSGHEHLWAAVAARRCPRASGSRHRPRPPHAVCPSGPGTTGPRAESAAPPPCLRGATPATCPPGPNASRRVRRARHVPAVCGTPPRLPASPPRASAR